jgi:hypothetical protein
MGSISREAGGQNERSAVMQVADMTTEMLRDITNITEREIM